MEWVSIKPSYVQGGVDPSPGLEIFTVLAKAGFHLEVMRRNVDPAVTEYFYFHPTLHIQVHEVQEPEGYTSQFFIFYPDGSTAFAKGAVQLLGNLPAAQR